MTVSKCVVQLYACGAGNVWFCLVVLDGTDDNRLFWSCRKLVMRFCRVVMRVLTLGGMMGMGSMG